VQTGQFLPHGVEDVVVFLKLGGSELARRNVGVSYTRTLAVDDHGGEVVGTFFVQHGRLGDGAGSDDTLNASFHRPAAGGFTHLLGDGDAVALLDETGDVALDGVIGHTRHRHTLALGHRP